MSCLASLFCFFAILSFISKASSKRHIGVSEHKIKFYADNGTLHYIDLTTPLDTVLELYYTRRHFSGSTRFWLYTRDNMNNYQEMYTRFTKKSIAKLKEDTLYRPDRPLVMVTHGWMSNGYSNATQLIKKAFLKLHDTNVIVVDWQNDAAHDNYLSSASLTMLVAEKVKDMILSLALQYRLKESDVHLIGHSLGAHVMGLAGEKLKDHKFIVARVTGLDPAGPFFEVPNYLPGITSESAKFVDIIHTNSGVLGYISSIGHVDFYPNGGNWQPHCCDNEDSLGCEHVCAYVYFAETIKGSKYVSIKCDSYFSYLIGSCTDNDKQYMGLACMPTARGYYYLDIDN